MIMEKDLSYMSTEKDGVGVGGGRGGLYMSSSARDEAGALMSESEASKRTHSIENTFYRDEAGAVALSKFGVPQVILV